MYQDLIWAVQRSTIRFRILTNESCKLKLNAILESLGGCWLIQSSKWPCLLGAIGNEQSADTTDNGFTTGPFGYRLSTTTGIYGGCRAANFTRCRTTVFQHGGHRPSKSSWSSCVHRYMQSSSLIIDKRGSVYFRCNAHVGHPSEALQLPPKKIEELLSKCQDEMNATRIARSAATGVGESEDFTFYIFSTHEFSSICQFLPSNDINWN